MKDQRHMEGGGVNFKDNNCNSYNTNIEVTENVIDME